MNQIDVQDSDLEQALRQQFHEHYGDPPAVAPLWAHLSARLTPREDRPAKQRGLLARALQLPSRSGRRLSLRQAIALGVFLLVIVGAASYSASILLQPLLQVPAAAGRVYMHVNQTRTLGDVTITVEQAVVDSEGVIIGVSAERPCVIPSDDCLFDLAPPRLTTQDGQIVKQYAILSDYAYRPGKQEVASVFFFKPPQLSGQPANLALHLEIRRQGYNGEPVGDAAVFDFTLPNHIGSSS